MKYVADFCYLDWLTFQGPTGVKRGENLQESKAETQANSYTSEKGTIWALRIGCVTLRSVARGLLP